MIRFTINGQKFESPEERVSVEWLLKRVGSTPKDTELVREDSGETWSDPSAEVELRERDKFEGRPLQDPPPPKARIHFRVNGEALVTTKTALTLEEILRLAGADAAIDLDELESYYLDNLGTDEMYENLGDEVPIVDGDEFVALYAGKTPVA